MAKFILFDLENSKFHNEYEEDEKKVFGGPWGDESKHVHLPIPDGVDYRKCIIIEVVLIPPNTEDDIDFDYKCEYTDNFTQVTKYYKFEVDAGKSSQVDLDDAAAATKAAKNARLQRGRLFRELASNVHDIIADHCYANNLTLEQIGTLKANNATAFQLLSENQPLSAKLLIDQVVADGTLVTQDMLDDVALEYAEFAESYPDMT